MNTIAELLAERKRIDARISRAVAKAFPVGSRWMFKDRYSRTRTGIVVVQAPRKDSVSVKWENITDNYDQKCKVWAKHNFDKPFTVEPGTLSPLTPSAASAGG